MLLFPKKIIRHYCVFMTVEYTLANYAQKLQEETSTGDEGVKLLKVTATVTAASDCNPC